MTQCPPLSGARLAGNSPCSAWAGCVCIWRGGGASGERYDFRSVDPWSGHTADFGVGFTHSSF